jgi:hypothetical protein
MTGMTAYALVALLAFAALGALATLSLRRRRATRLPLDPLPAGMKHLASQVGALSHFGAGLRIEPGARLRRVGTLNGVR